MQSDSPLVAPLTNYVGPKYREPKMASDHLITHLVCKMVATYRASLHGPLQL